MGDKMQLDAIKEVTNEGNSSRNKSPTSFKSRKS